MITQKEIEKVHTKYKNAVNMNFTELKIWSKNPLSKKASLSREPIKRNLKLLSTPKYKWGAIQIQEANKTISYLARAKKIKRKKGTPKGELSPNEIALRNWGYDVYKKKNKYINTYTL